MKKKIFISSKGFSIIPENWSKKMIKNRFIWIPEEQGIRKKKEKN